MATGPHGPEETLPNGASEQDAEEILPTVMETHRDEMQANLRAVVRMLKRMRED